MSAEESALPDHWSWFNFISDSLQHRVEELAGALGAPVTDALGRGRDEKWFFGGQFHADHIFGSLFVLLVIGLLAFAVKRRFANPEDAVIPEDRLTAATFAELITQGVLNFMTQVMDKERARYFLPLIGSCAFVIFISNAMGLVPGSMSPTANLNTTAAMAVVIFVATHVYGVKTQGPVAYFKHFMGPMLALAPLILVIEIVSHFVRPVTLSIRLTANMFADHAVLAAFLGLSASAFFLPFPVAAYILGCVVVTVQTLVFCLLSMVYIGAATEPHHDH